jgi:hypothetical protein
MSEASLSLAISVSNFLTSQSTHVLTVAHLHSVKAKLATNRISASIEEMNGKAKREESGYLMQSHSPRVTT